MFEDELADKYEDHQLLCPHCGIVVNEELVQKEAEELLEASPQRVKELSSTCTLPHTPAACVDACPSRPWTRTSAHVACSTAG